MNYSTNQNSSHTSHTSHTIPQKLTFNSIPYYDEPNQMWNQRSTIQAIPRITVDSTQDFFDQYMLQNWPVIITNFQDKWASQEAFSTAALDAKVRLACYKFCPLFCFKFCDMSFLLFYYLFCDMKKIVFLHVLSFIL